MVVKGRSRRGSTGPDALSVDRAVVRIRCALAVVAAAVVVAPEAGHATSCAQPPLRFGGREYVPITFAEPLRLGRPLTGATLPRLRGSGDDCETEDQRVVALEIAGVSPRYAVALYGQPRVVWAATNRCRTERRAAAFVVCFRRPLRYRGRAYLPVPASIRTRESLGRAQLGSERVDVSALRRIDPAVAVAVRGLRDRVFVAPGTCLQPFADELGRCLRAGFALRFEPPSGRPGETLRVRVDGSPRRVSRARLSFAGPGGTVPIGRLGRGGALALEVPDVEPGAYSVVARGVDVGRFSVEEPAYSRAALIGLLAAAALTAAALAALKLRRR